MQLIINFLIEDRTASAWTKHMILTNDKVLTKCYPSNITTWDDYLKDCERASLLSNAAIHIPFLNRQKNKEKNLNHLVQLFSFSIVGISD